MIWRPASRPAHDAPQGTYGVWRVPPQEAMADLRRHLHQLVEIEYFDPFPRDWTPTVEWEVEHKHAARGRLDHVGFQAGGRAPSIKLTRSPNLPPMEISLRLVYSSTLINIDYERYLREQGRSGTAAGLRGRPERLRGQRDQGRRSY